MSTAPQAHGGLLVGTLGVTQVIGYGTVYYSYPVLAPGIGAEFGVSLPVMFALMSAGLWLGALAAPVLGGCLDRFGAARVMTAGSMAMAVLLLLSALAPGIVSFGAVVILLEVLSFAVLYDAAFALLAQKRPADTRAAITRLTLIAGFASTIFWPLTSVLVAHWGWRPTQVAFAVLHLGCALLHARLIGCPVATAAPETASGAVGQGVEPPAFGPAFARRVFWLLAVGFALTGMAITAVTVHLIAIIESLSAGAPPQIAAMLMGPAQVAVRVLDATLWRHQHPLWVAILSSALICLALGLTFLPGAALVAALVFPVALGAGAGLGSIVRGAVPAALFGARGLGRRLGQLTAVRNALGAVAPFLFAWASMALSPAGAMAATGVVAVAGLIALIALHQMLTGRGHLPKAAGSGQS